MSLRELLRPSLYAGAHSEVYQRWRTTSRVWRATPKPEPSFERFCLGYPSGTVVMAFYADGAPLEEVRVTHPLALVEVVEDSLVGVGSRVFWARA
jgi:hypothetical protein